MFVINRMTKNPMTVTADTKVDEVAHLMKKHNFRRLPVVDDGKLVGFLSDSDLMRVAPSPATTLSRYEINSLLAKICVRDIMKKDVVSINAMRKSARCFCRSESRSPAANPVRPCGVLSLLSRSGEPEG